jgi:Rps23 Pro-64 3,4-dihydroxylase Tpa1-like proline 4-hydroxylase
MHAHNDAGLNRGLCAVLYLNEGWRRAYRGELYFDGLPGVVIKIEPIQNCPLSD